MTFNYQFILHIIQDANVYDSGTSLSEEVLTAIFKKLFQAAPKLLQELHLLVFWLLTDKTPALPSNSFITFTILYLLCFFFHDRKMFIQERCTQKVQYFILISPIKQNMKDRRKESKKGRRKNNPLFPIKFDKYLWWKKDKFILNCFNLQIQNTLEDKKKWKKNTKHRQIFTPCFSNPHLFTNPQDEKLF